MWAAVMHTMKGPDTERIPAFIELINQGEEPKLKTDWKPGNLGKKTGLFSEFSQLLSLN